MRTSFRTVILEFGNNTGIEVPEASLRELGAGKRPPVFVTVAGYDYRSTVGAMGGRSLVSLSKAHRDAAGLAAGDTVDVTLVLDEAPRDVEVPASLTVALDREGLAGRFAACSYSRRKEWARQVAEAKTETTRERRIGKVLDLLSHTSQ